MYALVNGRIFTGHGVLDNHAVVIAEGLIERICPRDTLDATIPQQDVAGAFIAPGFIDLQVLLIYSSMVVAVCSSMMTLTP